VTLGRALVELGDFDAASAELEEALRAAPENLAAIRALAEIHKRRTELPEAIEHYQSAFPAPEVEDPPPARDIPIEAVVAEEPVAAVEEIAAEPEPVVSPTLARLETFLAAIERARREIVGQAAL
jgi:tetratricopeptide (TPR) repeat protein